MRSIILALGFCGAFASGALADPGVTVTAATMRASPSAKSHIVQSIPAHAQIDMMECAHGWCRASWRDQFGYLPLSAVAFQPDAGYAGPPAYGPPPVVVGPWGPYYGYYGYYGWHGGWRYH
jgi:hypothetical protein